MKYTSPIYEREQVETADIMETSPYSVAYVNKTIKVEDPNNPGSMIEKEVTTTQVTVDMGSLIPTTQY